MLHWIHALIMAGVLAIVPSTGAIIHGPRADCVAMALEVRFQLAELATSDGDAYPIYRDKLREFALAQSADLDVCVRYGKQGRGR